MKSFSSWEEEGPNFAFWLYLDLFHGDISVIGLFAHRILHPFSMGFAFSGHWRVSRKLSDHGGGPRRHHSLFSVSLELMLCPLWHIATFPYMLITCGGKSENCTRQRPRRASVECLTISHVSQSAGGEGFLALPRKWSWWCALIKSLLATLGGVPCDMHLIRVTPVRVTNGHAWSAIIRLS